MRAAAIVLALAGSAAVALSLRPAAAPSVATTPRFEPAPSTSRDDLQATIAAARSRLARAPGDAAAAASLADALLRLARVESAAAHAVEAERVLQQVLRSEPGEYTALRMLGAVYLSQHRFREAAAAAERARALRPDDAWNYGVLGDASLELGDYERAFAAFDTMTRLRPDAASYARVAYAHELQGRLDEAIAAMRLAIEATGAQDPESLAWHHAQLGHLYLETGDVDAAAHEYARADFVFAGHPYARAGLARIALARGDLGAALQAYRALLAEAPSPEIAATTGDLLAAVGDSAGAQALYARAAALEREGWEDEEPQPAALAAMLAERGLEIGEAVALAERAARLRSDIHTMDALALAYFRAGRLDEAADAAARALRTGTRSRRVLYHAAAVAHARGRDDEARGLLARMPDGPVPEPLVADGLARLKARLQAAGGTRQEGEVPDV